MKEHFIYQYIDDGLLICSQLYLEKSSPRLQKQKPTLKFCSLLYHSDFPEVSSQTCPCGLGVIYLYTQKLITTSYRTRNFAILVTMRRFTIVDNQSEMNANTSAC